MEVQSLAVGRMFRGAGIGRMLMEHSIALAKVYSASVKLHCSVFNARAMSLYKSLGFQPVKWLFDYYRSEAEDALEMLLLLSS
jgi:ribosomal protein S18 acetylase RimI-like enzyme